MGKTKKCEQWNSIQCRHNSTNKRNISVSFVAGVDFAFLGVMVVYFEMFLGDALVGENMR